MPVLVVRRCREPLSLAALICGAGLAFAEDAPLPTSGFRTEATTPDKPAETKAPPELIGFAAGVRLQSDYNFRGISQSNHEPSTQSYFETRLFDNNVYFGIAQYKVDLPTRPPMEMDLTAGIRPTFGPLALDLGIIYYNYPSERRLLGLDGAILTPANTDFPEAAARASWTATDNLTFGANTFYTSNWMGTHSRGMYSSGTVKYTFPKESFGFLPEGFAVSAEFGHYSFGTTSPQLGRVKLPSYNYGNAGLSYIYKNVTLDVRYHNTDLRKRECFTLTTDPRGVFTGSGRSNWCG